MNDCAMDNTVVNVDTILLLLHFGTKELFDSLLHKFLASFLF